MPGWKAEKAAGCMSPRTGEGYKIEIGIGSRWPLDDNGSHENGV